MSQKFRYRVGRDTGSVTAEFAVVLPVAMIVAAMLVNAVVIGVQQVRLEQAAAAAARELARGEPADGVTATVSRMAGSQASAQQEISGSWASVTVSRPTPGPVGWLNIGTLEARAHAPYQWVISP